MTRCTDRVFHFEKASSWGKRCTVSNEGARIRNKFTKGSSSAAEHLHASGGKVCHISNGATHNSLWIITAPTQVPGIPFHAFCISFSHFYTKLENTSQETMLLAHLSFALGCCGWQSEDTDSWQLCCTNQGTANFVDITCCHSKNCSSHAKVHGLSRQNLSRHCCRVVHPIQNNWQQEKSTRCQ